MKIALCFIINYEHILNKEEIWREWIEPNKDIINVYFYYKDLRKIKSKWIMEHTLPPNFIYETTYFHVMPAYISLLKFACNHDNQNKWFCMLTDACCPIISPKKFRYLFYNEHNYSLLSWKSAWWNPYYHQRGNLAKLPKDLWLANDPWFILTKENVKQVLHFVNTQKLITETVCSGGLANETFFAIVFKYYKELENKSHIICASTHITDWRRHSSVTSPHVFRDANEDDIKFIEKELERNPYYIFIRKVAPEFPNKILRHYIYDHDKEDVDALVIVEPAEVIFNRYSVIGKKICYMLSLIIMLYILKIYVI
jgi:hypothetical protein